MLNKATHGFHAQNWAQAVSELSQSATDYVLVTVLGSAGSTPRAAGSKMVVTGEHIYDTIGGGHLEFEVIEQARQRIADRNDAQTLEHFPLGASLGQCCGGSVTVLFEPMLSQTLPVDVYGAGHVAQALMTILSGLPVRVRWIDSRADLFPEQVPANVTVVVDDHPVEQVKRAVPGASNIILTHNHQLDFELTEKLIQQNQASFIGVIGSQTKAKRFRMRLVHKRYQPEQVAQMTCPVGLPDIQGKLPMEVAVSIAAQLMQQYQQKHQEKSQQHAPATQTRQGVQWQQIKSKLKAGVINE